MSEATVQAALQTALQAMGQFANADVTIGDWGILDGPNENAPYAVIEPADGFETQYRVKTPESRWDEYLTLVVRFVDWETSLPALRDIRQAVIDMLDAQAGALGLAVRSIRNDGPIGNIYPAYLSPEQAAGALPAFLSQRCVVVCEEF